MLQFDRLRINGFKSFVDRTELDIGPGLNGIVGPNGCGKSNLVEALRWVMGEASAKRMRGDGMEDVIFNGTDKRSPRNIAEVSLLLDNASRNAPAAYNGSDEIEVIRRIERDRGSNYKINGKTMRARDVQMLFADTVSGANSPALVSQGQVAKIINAKPLERRLILEESAGISGLYARRHEAEIRLRAADNNLVRIEDILGSMEGRLNGLKRQARQASRYRNLAAQIRQMETLIAYMEWEALHNRAQETRRIFDSAESVVAGHLAAVTQLTKTHVTQSEDLPSLRQKEVEAAASLQTQRLTLQRLEDDAARYEQALQELHDQLAQSETDLAHETQSRDESAALLEKSEAEHAKIVAEQGDESGELEAKGAAKDTLEGKVLELEESYNALMQSAAEARAAKDSAQKRLDGNAARYAQIKTRIESTQAELSSLQAQQGDAPNPDLLKGEIETAERALEQLKGDLQGNEDNHDTALRAVDTAREALKTIETKKSEFDTEISLLEGFLDQGSEGELPPVLNAVSPDEGFEKALSRALGDSLLASLEKEAQAVWLSVPHKLDALPPLPAGCAALLPHIKAPKALHAALSQIGYVDDDAQGAALIERLLPGQALVSQSGSYWRWDGYSVKSTAKDRHSQHLEQKNQLAALIQKRPQLEKLVADAQKAMDAALKTQEDLRAARQGLSAAIQTQDGDLSAKRKEWQDLRETQTRFESERNRLEDVLTLLNSDATALEATLEEDRKQIAVYDDTADSDKAQRLERLKAQLQEARQALSEAVRAYDLYVQQQNTRKARLQALADERISLQNRNIRARERMKQLEARKAELSEKLGDMTAQPKNSRAEQEALLSRISELEVIRSTAAEKLAEREREVSETAKALKTAEQSLSDAREQRAGAQATLKAVQEQIEGVEASIVETFDMQPRDLPQHAAIDMDRDFGDLE
ncbi:MAG: AAA family ATPase, partial [Bdellovibrionales bacterium]